MTEGLKEVLKEENDENKGRNMRRKEEDEKAVDNGGENKEEKE